MSAPATFCRRLPFLVTAFALALLLRAAPSDAQIVAVPDFEVAHGILLGSGDLTVDDLDGLLYFGTERQVGLPNQPYRFLSRYGAVGALGPVRYDDPDLDIAFAPAVSPRAQGGFATIWRESRDDGNSESRVLGRFLDADGQPSSELITISEREQYHGSTAVLGLAKDAVFAWWASNPSEVRARLFRADGHEIGTPFVIGDATSLARVDLGILPSGGFVAGWAAGVPGQPNGGASARIYSATGVPLGEPIVLSTASELFRMAVDPTGQVLAMLGGRQLGGSFTNTELWVRRMLIDGTPLEDESLVAAGPADAALVGDLEFDWNGNLYVTWTDVNHRDGPVSARGYGTDGLPIGPPVAVGLGGAFSLRTTRLSDGRFLNAFGRPPTGEATATVTSLCVPGTSVCGDDVHDVLCERCDAGAANSDTTPDACRSDCRPAHCGDGTVDAGETCDDGNRAACDGCARDCTVEVGLGCGDGIALPACGEPCDDGNPESGDGCTPACTLERIPGGGSPTYDCHAEWSIANTANEPRYDALGNINGVQSCVDDDPRCDTDGGVPGSCTFALAVCVNNTNLAACTPELRVRAWELRKPSASRALRDPASAAIRAAFQSVVPGAVIGPETRDLCSPPAAVTVALKGFPAKPRAGKLVLGSRATLYSGRTDSDKLTLFCRPHP